jgi:arginine/lysine/ornithine decarboxylase
LADPNNVLFILPLLKAGQNFPLQESVKKIKRALFGLPTMDSRQEEVELDSQKVSTLVIPYKEMMNLKLKEVHISAALDEVCAETIIPYPPGIPLLIKGERITNDKLNQLNRLIKAGARFQGGFTLNDELIKTFCKA